MKKNSLNFLLLLLVIIALPLIILTVTNNNPRLFDMRPKALTRQANLTLIADTTSVNIQGQVVVLIKAQLTETTLRMSGADITVQYDKTRLRVVSAEPATVVQNAANPFTDAPIVNPTVAVDTQFNGVRIAQIANRPSAQLPGGVVPLGKITFEAIAPGAATIKFPSDTNTMEIVGIQLP